jgi:hypothetical protein
LLWYVSYGSNLCAARFACYLAGGRPPGAARCYPGCRDVSPPRDTAALWLPGRIYFAEHSTVWGGGMAFYDPTVAGRVAARGYLITAEQFADVAAQEMHRAPGRNLDLSTVVTTGRQRIGPGRYETLLCTGNRDGRPMLTFTAPWNAAGVGHTTPAPEYLDLLATGVAESHGWTPIDIARYLSAATAPASVDELQAGDSQEIDEVVGEGDLVE